MEHNQTHWRARLPEAWHADVVPPLDVEAHSDDSLPASKWRGYDEHGVLCYYRHHYAQWNYGPDDDRRFMRLMRSESFEAWRLGDGRWLRRVQTFAGPDAPGQVTSDSGYETVPPQMIPRL